MRSFQLIQIHCGDSGGSTRAGTRWFYPSAVLVRRFTLHEVHIPGRLRGRNQLLEEEHLKALIHKRAEAGMLVILIQQWHARGFDGLCCSESLGAKFADPGNLLLDRREVFMRSVFGVGQLTDPLRAGSIEDKADLVAGLLRFPN
jgi:hypothetical protein